MDLDWSRVQELAKPSPSYQELARRLIEVFSYEFVRQHYNHSMLEAEAYAARLLDEDTRQRYTAWSENLRRTFRQLDNLGVKTCLDFIRSVATTEKLEEFWQRSGLPIEDLIAALKYLLNWVLPTRLLLTELVEADALHAQYLATLRASTIRSTLDLLHQASTRRGREALSRATGIPEAFLHDLVNRADFTRLPYTRGATVKNYFGAGYNTLDKLAQADLDTLTADMVRYGESIGKQIKSGMEFDSGVRIARILPKLVEP